MKAFRRLDPLSRAGLVCLLVLVAFALGSVLDLGGDPERIVGPRLRPPDARWWLGTDNLGRAMLPRVMEGVATTLLLSSAAVLLTAVVSAAFGILAGYRGGYVNELVMRLVEVLYAFPAIILAVLVSAVAGPGRTAAMAAIVLVTIPLMTRLVRTAAAGVAGRDYVTAAVISGAGLPRVLGRHVLPNVSGTIAVQGTYALSVGIAVEGGLSFLGLGVQPPRASLGVLIQQGGAYLVAAPWLLVGPGAVLVTAILALNVLGDGLRDLLEPRETRSLV
ncbi:ABC transporter permease [Actinomadura vinacea]|uniref:ABC transporter permease n=1 Tax=Actinomadura vinacea TaxID=115336 RepID=A0ABN3J4D1_9ACTN